MLTIAIAAAILLICIGALLGATWTRRVLQERFRQRASQQAAERRMLATAWAAIHRQRGECPHCIDPLPEQDRHFASRVIRTDC
jgi:hypothetical protein